MITFTFYPASSGTPITFSKDATDYRLLKRYSGWAYVDVENISTQKSPCQHGNTPKCDILSDRVISFDIMITSIGATDMQQQQALVAALTTALNPIAGAGILKRTNDDGTEYLVYARPHLPQLSDNSRTMEYQLATLEFLCMDPFIYSGSPSIAYLDPNPGNFFPFPNGTGVWPWSLASSTSTASCNNTGQAETPIIVTFTGPMTNPALSVTKMVAGVSVTETLSLTITMIAGDTLVVNTDPDIMTAYYYPVAGGTVNANKYIDVDASMWQMGVGMNAVHITTSTSSTGAAVSVQWTNKYVGV